GRNRRVEQLVPGAEERAAEDRLSGSCRDGGLETWSDETGDACDERRNGRRAGRHRQSQPLQRDATGRRLNGKGDHADGRVVEGEKAEQAISASKVGDRLHLE